MFAFRGLSAQKSTSRRACMIQPEAGDFHARRLQAWDESQDRSTRERLCVAARRNGFGDSQLLNLDPFDDLHAAECAGFQFLNLRRAQRPVVDTDIVDLAVEIKCS